MTTPALGLRSEHSVAPPSAGVVKSSESVGALSDSAIPTPTPAGSIYGFKSQLIDIGPGVIGRDVLLQILRFTALVVVKT